MTEEKINISWDELRSPKVEHQVRQQQGVQRNRSYAQMTPADLQTHDEPREFRSIFYNEIVYLTLFGLIGGLLAWGGSAAMLHLRPDPRAEEAVVMRSVDNMRNMISIDPTQVDRYIEETAKIYQSNPYVMIDLDKSLSSAQRKTKMAALDQQNEWRDFLAGTIAFGICGLMISVSLSIAEPLVDRNLAAVIINGSVGAVLGVAGGLAASLFVDRVYSLVGRYGHGVLWQSLAWAASWAVLGCFVAIAPGIIARNFKRMVIGIFGGALGGALGGLLLVPLNQFTGTNEIGRMIALVAIGIITGVAIGLIEKATRTGWLKVTAGLIAGKQFILYRNPTYVGCSPDCQIYLFRDPQVGRRHAAIHLLKGKFELENLPLGQETLVNGEPVTRQRLRHGDKIQIGATAFTFQEKNKGN